MPVEIWSQAVTASATLHQVLADPAHLQDEEVMGVSVELSAAEASGVEHPVPIR
jgi:hypothetical protein